MSMLAPRGSRVALRGYELPHTAGVLRSKE